MVQPIIAIGCVIGIFILYTMLVIHNVKNKPHKGAFKKTRYRNIENIVAKQLLEELKQNKE